MRNFVKDLLNTNISKATKCATMKQDTTAEMKVYLSRFCQEMLTTADTVTKILKAPVRFVDVSIGEDF